ncbi:leucine-rich repeat-containing protein 72-like isoform X2 [Pomacea canaliculata]|uniref:leucine-rich repeat-containing protein 72-like isoform X2 n=1 Tax=Pomacea canaliculata TaxID=400727 RepID=UPI000D72AAB8|nr:leucine-rich repeat-containing protein 72-like isoform X2 [Pomacea canaliculata]
MAAAPQITRYSTLSELIVNGIMVSNRIKKDKDVTELYLAHRNLTDVHDLKRFPYLMILWLNGNQLRYITCLSTNFRLCELYLHDNKLTEIPGALRHLTCLRVLMLHNNQLTKLEKVLSELQKMLSLQTLSLFDNPIALEPEYRLFVIHKVPSLSLLDRQGEKEYANNYLKNSPIHENPEEAILNRRLKKSLTLFTSFDWSKIPRFLQRRTSDNVFGEPAIVTRVYR